MNLESRKEKKGTLMKEHFILLLLLLFSYLSNRICPSGDQTSTFSRPGHFLIATGDRVPEKMRGYPHFGIPITFTKIYFFLMDRPTCNLCKNTSLLGGTVLK